MNKSRSVNSSDQRIVNQLVSPVRQSQRDQVVPTVRDTLFPIRERVEKTSKNITTTQTITVEKQQEARQVVQIDISYYENTIQLQNIELQGWRRKYLDLSAEQDRVQCYEETIKQLEYRIKILVDENRKVIQQLKDKINELEDGRIITSELQVVLQNFQSTKNESQNLYILLNTKQVEYEDLMSRYNALEGQNQDMKDFERASFDKDGIIKALQFELELLSDGFRDLERKKGDAVDQLKQSRDQSKLFMVPKRAISDGEHHLSHLSDGLRQQLKMTIEESDQLRKLALEREVEIIHQEHTFEEFTHRVDLMTVELQRVYDLLAASKQEIQGLNDQLDGFNETIRISRAYEQEISLLKQILQNKQKEQEQFRVVHTQTQKELMELRWNEILQMEKDNQILSLQTEIEKLSQALRAKVLEVEQYRQKYILSEQNATELRKHTITIDSNEQEVFGLQLENENLKNRLSQRDQQVNELDQQISQTNDRVRQIAMLEIEIKRLEDTLNHRSEEVNNLQQRLNKAESLVSSLKAFQGQSSELEHQITVYLQDIENLRIKLREALEDLKKAEFNLEQQDYKLLQLSQFEQQIGYLKGVNQGLLNESKERRIQLVQSNLQAFNSDVMRDQMTSKVDFHQEDNDRLNKSFIEAVNERQKHQDKANSFETKLYQLQKEFDSIEAQSDQGLNDRILYLTEQLNQQRVRGDTLELQLDQSERQLKSRDQQFQIDFNQQALQNESAQRKVEDFKSKYLSSDVEVTKLSIVEGQFKDASQRCTQLEVEYERLNQQLQRSNQDNEQLKTQVNDMENELQQLSQVQFMGTQLRTRLDNEIKEKQQLKTDIPSLNQQLDDQDGTVRSLEQTIQRLTSEVERLDKIIQGKVQDNENLRERCNILQTQVAELKFLELRVPDLENVVQLHTSEIQRVNEIHTARHKDNQTLSQELTALQLQPNLEKDLQRQVTQYEIKLLEIKQLKNTQVEMELQISKTLKQSDFFQGKLEVVQSDFERLKADQTNRGNELNEFYQLNGKMAIEIEDLKRELRRIPQLEQQLEKLTDENQRLSEQIHQNHDELDNARNKIITLQQLVDRYFPFLEQSARLDEIVHINAKVIIDHHNHYQDLSDQRDRDVNDLHQRIDKLEAEQREVEILQHQIKDLSDQVKQSWSDLQRQGQQVVDAQLKNHQILAEVQAKEVIIKEYQSMEGQFNQLRDLYEASLMKSDDLTQRLSKLDAEVTELRNAQQQAENKIAMFVSEIERLGVMIKNKNEDLETKKADILGHQQAITELNPVVSENDRLKNILQSRDQEIQDFKGKLQASQKALEELNVVKENLEMRAALLSSEIERLGIMLKNKKGENEQLKDDIKVNAQNAPSQAPVSTIDNSSQQQEINKLLLQLQQKVKEGEDANKKANGLEVQLQSLKSLELEVKRLLNVIETKDKDIAERSKSNDKQLLDVDRLEKVKYEYENKIALLSSEVERQNRKHEIAKQEIDKHKTSLAELQVQVGL